MRCIDRECYKFAKALIQSFALALDLEETGFDQFFDAPLTDVLIQHYFAAPDRKDHEEILFPHADFSGKCLYVDTLARADSQHSLYPPFKPAYELILLQETVVLIFFQGTYQDSRF